MRKTITALLFLTALVVIAPSAAASCHTGWSCSDDRRSHFDSGYDRGHNYHDKGQDRGGLFNSGPQDYQRGGLAHDYFHTDQFFGREIAGFPDTAFGEDRRYDRRDYREYNRHKSGGLFGSSYNDRYDSGPYGAYSGLALRYGEGFVSGQGFGDEYIGDPDQLNERVHTWSR